MKPYIETRNGIRYEFNSLTRKQRVIFTNKFQNVEIKDIQMLEDLVYTLLKFNYPDLTREEYEDILDYNESLYGFNELYEMLGFIIEDVFTLVGTEQKKVNPYLQYKKEQKTQ